MLLRRLPPISNNSLHYPRAVDFYNTNCYYDFDVQINNSGVYMILLKNDYFYIGKSKNIQKRMLEHINMSLDYFLYGSKKGYHTIARKLYFPLSKSLVNKDKIIVKLLSDDVKDEIKLIHEHILDKNQALRILNTNLYKNKK